MGHFKASYFKMLNDARVVSACLYVRTCQRVRNSKNIATIRDFQVHIRVNSTIIFDLLNPNPNDASAYMLSVLRFWLKKCIFWSKNMFLACCEAFTHFSLSIRIDNNVLLMISGNSSTCVLSSVYFKSKMWIFSILVKMPIFHPITLLKVFKRIYFSFWLLLNFVFRYFWIHMHTYWDLRIFW